MNPVIIIRYSEIALKGKNRPFFEKKLLENIKAFLDKNNIKYESFVRKRGFIVIHIPKKDNKTNLEFTKNYENLKNIFGISSISLAIETECDISLIKQIVKNISKEKKFSTFRITAKRSNKDFSLTSNEIDIKLGEFVSKLSGAKVSLKKFDLEISILIHDKAYVFTQKIKGKGGIPIGSEGKAICLLENNKSIRAALMMMKRGCELCFCSKTNFNISELEKNQFAGRGNMLKFTKINNYDEIPEISKFNGCKTLIVSGSIKETDSLNKKFKDLLVLNPVI